MNAWKSVTRLATSRILTWSLATMALVASATPASAALRRGLTWTVTGQQGSAVHVGGDYLSNAYSGDTTVDQYRPVLCIQVDETVPAPAIPYDFYNGWSRGTLKTTPPVQGMTLTSQQAGDRLCKETFGAGYRMAEFHDGRYGPDFSASGGWSFWGLGSVPGGTRFWVAINDQAANPWNSAGDPLPPDEDTVVKSRLSSMLQPLLNFAANPAFRNVVNNGVARRFDGDDNVLLTDVIRDAELAGAVAVGSPEWQSFKATVSSFQNVNGTAYYPQIYIPTFQDGAMPGTAVTMAAFETDLSRRQLPAYQIDASGNLVLLPFAVDGTYVETNEVWVLSVNERAALPPILVSSIQAMDAVGATSRKSSARGSTIQLPVAVDARSGLPQVLNGPACNPTGLRNDNGIEWFIQYKIPDPDAVEHWSAGKLEPRVAVVAKDGMEVLNTPFPEKKHKTVKNWVPVNLRITTWNRATHGDVWAYKWLEIDGGPKIELSLGLSAGIKAKIFGITADLAAKLDVKATFEKKFDDMGANVVNFVESTNTEYGTAYVKWNVCSEGGSGGTGNDNLALAALASASTTYPGYSAARTNDGSRDTSVNGTQSWANAWGAPMPQWVQLDFGTEKFFNTVTVYTSAGYAVRQYEIQIWNPFANPNGGAFQTIATVNNFTNATVITTPLPGGPYRSRLLRIRCLTGSALQPGYARINEIEVYF